MTSRFLLCTLLITLLLTSGCLENEADTPYNIENDNVSKITDSDVPDNNDKSVSETDYRQQMRDFVIDISTYSKQKDPDFIIIPQNGQELLTSGGEPDDLIAQDYIEAIDGVGREDLFFGYDDDNVATDEEDTEYMTSLLDIAKDNGVVVMVTDYCWTRSYVDASYQKNTDRGYISFAADSRDLDTIPDYPAEPFNVNDDDIYALDDASNFLYIINPEVFDSKAEFLESLQETDYDVILVDLFYYDLPLTSDDISSLKVRSNGGSRLVIAYMSIGESESYRYYWDDSWRIGSPEWLDAENPDWEGNYKVRYWDEEWQSLIYGNEDAYLDMIMDAGFDGVYLDIIDAFEYFEDDQ
ncbi:endo alpha-1,4 polygalactosaminidase [Methanolobus profundi]|uniref:Glycoside-hydrolase family GH114 TIM-barrel domain-containing protein n=1 Tax=Methanolobus profundi TaxID=487685 RepID=A0A1I4UUJ8_9EURY|nr:endo alpha-1,4 polygalactosaminidase [Methanolobus profundi]SFM92565.1 cysteinyl-tRNA synthetase, unknown class [Methanolobus profundi]